jgi:hypothetical protein
MIMRFRPANIRLINRRPILPRLLLALSSKEETKNDKNNPIDVQRLTGHSISGKDGCQLKGRGTKCSLLQLLVRVSSGICGLYGGILGSPQILCWANIIHFLTSWLTSGKDRVHAHFQAAQQTHPAGAGGSGEAGTAIQP